MPNNKITKMHAIFTKDNQSFMIWKSIGHAVASKLLTGINLWNYPNVVMAITHLNIFDWMYMLIIYYCIYMLVVDYSVRYNIKYSL